MNLRNVVLDFEFFKHFQVWKLWNENNFLPFIDSELHYEESYDDILRCIRIRLLCVQELAKVRPNMDNVVSMLISEIIDIPPPRQPSYVLNETGFISDSASKSQPLHSTNYISITDETGR